MLERVARTAFGGLGFGAAEELGRISFMFAAVFSCATISTSAGNSTFPLTWSPCVCVLMSTVTGFGVSSSGKWYRSPASSTAPTCR